MKNFKYIFHNLLQSLPCLFSFCLILFSSDFPFFYTSVLQYLDVWGWQANLIDTESANHYSTAGRHIGHDLIHDMSNYITMSRTMSRKTFFHWFTDVGTLRSLPATFSDTFLPPQTSASLPPILTLEFSLTALQFFVS